MEEESQLVMPASKLHYPLKIMEEGSQFQPKSMLKARIGMYI